MVRVYVLINVAVGKGKGIVKALTGVPGIKSVDAITGPYDLIVIIEVEDLNAVGRIVTNRVHATDGIIRTMTCPAVELS